MPSESLPIDDRYELVFLGDPVILPNDGAPHALSPWIDVSRWGFVGFIVIEAAGVGFDLYPKGAPLGLGAGGIWGYMVAGGPFPIPIAPLERYQGGNDPNPFGEIQFDGVNNGAGPATVTIAVIGKAV